MPFSPARRTDLAHAASAGGKMTPHRGNDFGGHTRGGHGDRDTRIEIPPGCQGDDLKTMLASC